MLDVLTAHMGVWVDGTLLATEEVGGSEGLKRLRELKAEGHLIQKRAHPDPRRAIYQYRLVAQSTLSGEPSVWAPKKKEEVPRGRDNGPTASIWSNPAARPSPPAQGGSWEGPQSDTEWHHWKPAKKAPGTLEYIFWIGKQRVIGGIANLGDGRWGWGVVIPPNKGRMTKERRAGHGVQPDKEAARFAVEECIRALRKTGDV